MELNKRTKNECKIKEQKHPQFSEKTVPYNSLQQKAKDNSYKYKKKSKKKLKDKKNTEINKNKKGIAKELLYFFLSPILLLFSMPSPCYLYQ